MPGAWGGWSRKGQGVARSVEYPPPHISPPLPTWLGCEQRDFSLEGSVKVFSHYQVGVELVGRTAQVWEGLEAEAGQGHLCGWHM